LDEDNQLFLKMMVAGDSRDRALELARRMEDSGRFTQTYIYKEHTDPAATRNGDTVEFEINGIYVPETTAAPAQKVVISKRSTP